VPIDGEQHRAEHDIVVPVKPVADGRDQLLSVPSRVLIASTWPGVTLNVILLK
jgi:hypothetical protein